MTRRSRVSCFKKSSWFNRQTNIFYPMHIITYFFDLFFFLYSYYQMTKSYFLVFRAYIKYFYNLRYFDKHIFGFIFKSTLFSSFISWYFFVLKTINLSCHVVMCHVVYFIYWQTYIIYHYISLYNLYF